jgi:flagellar biosynthesis protein FlhA
VYGELDGIPGIEPAFGMAVTWIDPDQKAHALGQGYQVVEVPSAIATHCSKVAAITCTNCSATKTCRR